MKCGMSYVVPRSHNHEILDKVILGYTRALYPIQKVVYGESKWCLYMTRLALF